MLASVLNLLGGGVLSKIVDGVSGFFQKAAEEREAAAALQAKIVLAKVNKDAKLELAEHELQVMRTQAANTSWKDEYVTVLVSVPIIVSVIGAVAEVFSPEIGGRLLFPARSIAGVMTGETIDFAELWLIVVTVSLGTKPFRKK